MFETDFASLLVTQRVLESFDIEKKSGKNKIIYWQVTIRWSSIKTFLINSLFLKENDIFASALFHST